MINIHHNYCNCETCQIKDLTTNKIITKDLWITRKGATSAKKGELGIIPGSMGVGSYIVRGKGNMDSWRSCSHGAGRRLSRTKAKKMIS
jgi:tRNA-splicing ligase RtcB